MRYRKKPVEIEAVQWDGDNWGEVCKFAGISLERKGMGGPTLVIPTLEGDLAASRGDWIIRGVRGELYPCKPYIFEDTYERVE